MLGSLEKEIMEIVWEDKEVDARHVQSVIKKRRKIAYTTVNTVLSRLVDKKLLKARKIGSRGGFKYIYSSMDTKERYEKKVIDATLSRLLKSFGGTTIKYFSENLNLSKEEVNVLRRKLEELKDE
ncbi:MAG: BlaI/MecI/CopY family transcriptional regulator [Euryarchaeota archaeon]|nr:BlaI/MecI/CopY family transcriptional regulator [Euryarchaeota archaeon]